MMMILNVTKLNIPGSSKLSRLVLGYFPNLRLKIYVTYVLYVNYLAAFDRIEVTM